jgi:hypothetical protein
LIAATAVVCAAAAPAGQATRAGACGPPHARAAFTTFVDAFNRGDLPRLDTLFAKWPEFAWYSSGEPGLRTNSSAITRSTLLPYFRSRHIQHDRLRVTWFRFNSTARAMANFSFGLRRAADDYDNGKPIDIIGKGALRCIDGTIVVLSLGGPALGGPDTTTR